MIADIVKNNAREINMEHLTRSNRRNNSSISSDPNHPHSNDPSETSTVDEMGLQQGWNDLFANTNNRFYRRLFYLLVIGNSGTGLKIITICRALRELQMILRR